MSSMGRMEMFAATGSITPARQMFEQAAIAAAEREWRGRLSSTDYRGDHWFTSLRGSEFPGDDPRYCPRKAIYGLMGVPHEKPMNPMVTGTAIVGSAVEQWNAINLMHEGRILAASEDPDVTKHVAFVDNNHWLTGSPDFVVIPPGWNRPHLIETKSKDAEVVVEMRNRIRTYDPGHRRQTLGYIGLGNRISQMIWPDAVLCKHTWKIAEPGIENVLDAMVCPEHGIQADSGCLIYIKLEPMRSGSLYYMGRNRPANVWAEYFFEHNERFFSQGLHRLANVLDHWRSGKMPDHPFGGKEWSESPCKFCDFKKETCKPDVKAGVSEIESSRGIEWAKNVYGRYDYEKARAQSLDRWDGKSGMTYSIKDNQGRELSHA